MAVGSGVDVGKRAHRRQSGPGSRIEARRISHCLGDPSRLDWSLGDCGESPTWAVVGLRSLDPRSPNLDILIAGACDQHVYPVRLYLSEFGPCESVDPDLMLDTARALRARTNPGAALRVLDKV